jgi:hypothetical protein
LKRKLAQISIVCRLGVRHTFGLLPTSGRGSFELIGLLLGQTQIGTTQRCAQPIDAPLREGVNAAGDMPKPSFRVVGK